IFFFFQAEDGIRDLTVTGVQTCALPISHCGATAGPYYVHLGPDGLMAAGGYYMMAPDQVARFRTAVDDDRRGDDLVKRLAAVERSEERRVGKECGGRRAGEREGREAQDM